MTADPSAPYRPLLPSIAAAAVRDRADDIAHVTLEDFGLSQLLLSTFRRPSTSTAPSAHPHIVIAVIGGTTLAEAREMREAVSAASKRHKVLLIAFVLVYHVSLRLLALRGGH